SGSTDETIQILQRYKKVNIIHKPFIDFASQCNFGLTRISSPWVLSLDADYVLSDELVDELAALTPPNNVVGYRVSFIYQIYGRPLRGSLYPPRTVLYRTDRGSYSQEGHAHRVKLNGDIVTLGGVIYHDDRKPLAR